MATKVDEISRDNLNTTTVSKEVNSLEGHFNYMSILFDNINDYRKDINDFDTNLEPVDIKEVMKHSYQILEYLLNESKKDSIKISMNLNEKVPTIITSDEKRLKQVLVNLISNAVKYTTSGTINLSVDSLKSPNGESDEIKFTVEDTGIGFTEDQMKLFSNNDTRMFSSTAMGLSICKRIVQKLGKCIECESNTKSTKVSFYIYDLTNQKMLENRINYNTTTNEEDFTKLLKNDALEKTIDKQINDDSVSIFVKNNAELKINSENKIGLNLSSNRSEINVVGSSRKVFSSRFKTTETKLNNLLHNKQYDKYKVDYINFNKALINYINYTLCNLDDYKYIIIIDDEEKNLKSLKNSLKEFLKEKGLKYFKIIKMNDAIECINLLYFDYLYFNKISYVISDLHMKLLNGDTFIKLMSQLNNKPFQKINFALSINNDNTKPLLLETPPNTEIIKKPCTKSELEKLFSNSLY